MHTITIEIPDADWPDYKKYFLLTHPNQTLEPGEENLSDDDWVDRKHLLFSQGSYEKGIRQEFEETTKPPIKKDIVKIKKAVHPI